MKKNKGFTLVEMLSVFALLTLMFFLVVPLVNSVLKDSRNDLYQSQINLIKGAARLWVSEEENKTFLESLNIWPYEITLGDLQESGFLEKDIKNPLIDNGVFHENMIIQINKVENSYEYLVLDEIDPFAPIITLNGDNVQEIELGQSYEDPGATAVSSNDSLLSVATVIKQNGIVVESIDTSTLGTYRVIYSAIDEEKSSSIARTVKIVDTEAPVLTCEGCPEDLIISMQTTENYQLPVVTATDNSGEAIEVYKTGSFSSLIPGERTVIYTATDSSGNRAILSIKFFIEKRYTFQEFVRSNPSVGQEATTGDGLLVNLGEYGIRYQGKNPDNFVYFNCSDYSNPTEETCELWRIIGVVDGKVKLIKSTSIGEFAWDEKEACDENGDYCTYDNNWPVSSLATYLNGTYLSSFRSKNMLTAQMIATPTWYLRSGDVSSTKEDFYNIERTTGVVYAENPASVTDNALKIGIMYPSDYGFAAKQGETNCTSTTTLFNYDDCKSSNWLAIGLYEWMITPYSKPDFVDAAVDLINDGHVDIWDVYDEMNIRPTLYLDDEVLFTGGKGTSDNPYTLWIENENVLTSINKMVSTEGASITSGDGQLVNLGKYGIRYQGKNPDNFVYFNCNDYNNPNASTCELWRIIGIVDGQFKLIRSESVNKMHWNDANSNKWESSTVKTYINETFYSTLTSVTKAMIKPATWYLKGWSTTDSITKAMMYSYERNGQVYGTNLTKLENTKIGLMYASDWGYAALESDTCPASQGLATYETCKNSNWLAMGTSELLINPCSHDVDGILAGGSSGYVVVRKTNAYNLDVRPVVYLLEKTIFRSGNGTSTDPYTFLVE